jgi:hypothetical protein
MKIQVRDLTGELCMTYEGGEILLERLRQKLALPDPVEVDFAGTRIHMSPYFNGSIVSLLADYTRDQLRERLRIQNLPAQAAKALNRCLDVGEEYYSKPDVRERLRQILDSHTSA